MKKRKPLDNLVIIGLTIIVIMSMFTSQPVKAEKGKPFFTIKASTFRFDEGPSYLCLLKQQLAVIGINVEIIILDWWFPGIIFPSLDKDIFFVSLSGGGLDPDFSGVYNENGSLNLSGYHTSMDYNETLGTGINEWYIEQGKRIMPPNSEERIQHYWDWEQYMMDKILPIQPLFATKSYQASWSNLHGYDSAKGIIRSWGKLSWNGYHTGQASTNEVVIADVAWTDLNPLFQEERASSFISDAILDPLFESDTDTSIHPHLVKDWRMINDTLVRLNIRQGIKWQDSPEGNFINEYLDIYDVFFTLYSYKELSNDRHRYAWIDEMVIINETCMDIYIDGDPTTTEKEPYTFFLQSLTIDVFPEHYLNQTQLADGVTPDSTHPSWATFASRCFGTGLFTFGSFTEGIETTLNLNNDCWLLDENVSKAGMDFDRRFGNFSQSPEQLRIKITNHPMERIGLYEEGKIDILDVSAFRSKRQEYSTNPLYNIQSFLQNNFGFFGYNLREERPHIGSREPCPKKPGITKGLAVRKAISYAINREEMNKVVHGGNYAITDHPVYRRLGVWCNPNIVRYNNDLKIAKYYMALAGYEEKQIMTVSSGFSYCFIISLLIVISFLTMTLEKCKKIKERK
jgi:ABC-type transport system substrate-binding protein